MVAAARSYKRVILDGTLGCPLCGAEFPIAAGVVCFGSSENQPVQMLETFDAMRVAALLNISTADSTFAIEGWPISDVRGLQTISPLRLIVFNPPDDTRAEYELTATETPMPMAVVRVLHRLPLADSSLAGVLVQSANPADYVRLLRSGGRLVAPAGFPVPDGVTELARDEKQWVSERNARSSPVSADTLTQLRRG